MHNKKRIYIIGISTSLILILLTARLFYIQISKNEFYEQEANRQRQINIPIDSGRGIIYDRNFELLTERSEKQVIVIFPQLFITNEQNIQYLQYLVGENEEKLIQNIKNSTHPIEFPMLKDKQIKNTDISIRGMYVINRKERYEEDALLCHIIGYINVLDKRGMSGIERAFDGILLTGQRQNISAIVDGKKRLLPGEGYTEVIAPQNKKHIRLKIDYQIQRNIEKVMDEKEYQGAVIVSDAKTGEILAMASRPSFNPNTISYHLQSQGDELYNKAIQMTFPPASIFKIIITAKALEDEILDLQDVFFCSGAERVGERETKCSSYEQGGHGEITFEQAFAKSCNCVFIQIAQQIGANAIVEMAERMGLGKIIDIGILEGEQGNLPKGDELLGPAIANIAIGQGNIEVTPLQINQVTQIILNNGVKIPLQLLHDITDQDKNIIERFGTKKEERIISEEIAIKLQYLMAQTTKQGTAQQVKELAKYTGGKTGTAQSANRGQSVIHGWFTGYYIYDDTKYAITVFIQEQITGSRAAVSVFKEIVKNIK